MMFAMNDLANNDSLKGHPLWSTYEEIMKDLREARRLQNDDEVDRLEFGASVVAYEIAGVTPPYEIEEARAISGEREKGW